MKVRLGIDLRSGYIKKAQLLKAPVLLSANALRTDKGDKWKRLPDFGDLDVALDSGGFVAAMNGGFKFSMTEYLDLVETMGPTWYAAMDYCCEPEIAGDRDKVAGRIDQTIESLRAMLVMVKQRDMQEPMPVAQGWTPDEYEGCLERMAELYDGGFPPLIGVGSVCRRPVHGDTGLFNVLNRIDQWLAAHGHTTKLHLFGVKGQALTKLRASFSDRVESTDSFAHAMRAQWAAWEARRSGDEPINRVDHMELWYHKNTPKQRSLWD